jgi:hypothetical protein
LASPLGLGKVIRCGREGEGEEEDEQEEEEKTMRNGAGAGAGGEKMGWEERGLEERGMFKVDRRFYTVIPSCTLGGVCMCSIW